MVILKSVILLMEIVMEDARLVGKCQDVKKSVVTIHMDKTVQKPVGIVSTSMADNVIT